MIRKKKPNKLVRLVKGAYKIYRFMRVPRENLPPLIPGQPKRIKPPRPVLDLTVNINYRAPRSTEKQKTAIREVRRLSRSTERALKRIGKISDKTVKNITDSYRTPYLPTIPDMPKSPAFPQAVSYPASPSMPKAAKAFKPPKPAKAPKAVPHPGTFKYVKVLRHPKTPKANDGK